MEEDQIISTSLQGLRLLIIEDDPLLALCMQDVVESAGCIVAGVAGTVAEALAKVASCTFDVALLDLHLRGQTVELIATAIKASGRIAVVATGADARSLPTEILPWPVLLKPYKYDELISALVTAVSITHSESA
jgi:CheY-like chemotaxis protein